MNKLVEKYKKNVIKFNPKVKVLVAEKTVTYYNLFEYNLITLSKAYSFIRRRFVYCQKCQTYKATTIHHLDRNHKNNKLTNWSLVCKRCHAHIHHFTIKGEVKILDLEGWTQFKESGFTNISSYPESKLENIFEKMLETCQK